MKSTIISRNKIFNAGKYVAATLLCLYLVPIVAQANPFGPQPEPINKPTPQQNPLSTGPGVRINSIEQLPPGIKDIAKKAHNEMMAKGYIEAPDEEVTYLQRFPQMVHPLSTIEGNLKIKLSDLETTSFNNLRFEGIVPEGPTPIGPWTSVSRIYSIPNGAIIRLFEWDYIADGGGITLQEETLNEKVNDRYRAIFSIKKSAKGNAISTLTWATELKYYTLTMTGHVRGNGMQKQFMALANSIRD